MTSATSVAPSHKCTHADTRARCVTETHTMQQTHTMRYRQTRWPTHPGAQHTHYGNPGRNIRTWALSVHACVRVQVCVCRHRYEWDISICPGVGGACRTSNVPLFPFPPPPGNALPEHVQTTRTQTATLQTTRTQPPHTDKQLFTWHIFTK